MVQLQTMMAVWNLGSNTAIRFNLRYTLRIMFQASNCERYWVYLKLWRKSLYAADDNTADIVALVADPVVRDGPEDAFAKSEFIVLQQLLLVWVLTSSAAHLYDAATMNHLMYVSVRNDFATRDCPENIWIKLAATPRSDRDRFFIAQFMFAQQGKNTMENSAK